ncbi:hypothetical protein [Enterococcus sp. BWR-S5]|uniref:hypothetical protein n=1 Tax=Enterococcus sp. BWR-S5 TaxID=2787714 RepID=UPI0019206D08|nr:hypothetical protein [Enterococcus sp. BWR-S5]MBL1224046.1 hypothetical protein [Enterococcus sp. BWR-S5]
MKRRTWILGASILLIASCLVFFIVAKKDTDASITIEQCSLDALSSEIKEVVHELEEKGAQTIQLFEISNTEGELLYAELSERRIYSEKEKSEFEVFLQYPQDKKSLVSKTYQDTILLISYRTGSTLNEHMTNKNSTSTSNAAAVNLAKEYCTFIPALGEVRKDGTRLGYAVFSDDKMMIESMKEDVDNIEKRILEDDFVYEYRLTVELIKAEI